MIILQIIVQAITLQTFAQTPVIDSLRTEISKLSPYSGNKNIVKDDTMRIHLLNELAWQVKTHNIDTSIVLGLRALHLAQKIHWYKGIANAFHNLGEFYLKTGDYPTSLKHYSKALDYHKKLNNKISLAATLGNIGAVHYYQGNYPKTLECFFKSLEMRKELGIDNLIATSLGNIGNVYFIQRNHEKALKFYLEALSISQRLKHDNAIARHLGNIALVYWNKGDQKKAIESFLEALEIHRQIGNYHGMSRHLGNLGLAYTEQNNVTKALEYYSQALRIDRALKSKNGIAANLGNIGLLHKNNGKYKSAIQYLDSALIISNQIGALNEYMQFEKTITLIYDTLARLTARGVILPGFKNSPVAGLWRKAYQHNQAYVTAKDSLFNEEKSKDIGRLEQKHEFELAEISRKQEEEQQARIAAASKERRDNLQYSLALIFIVFVFIGIFVVARRFRKLRVPTLSGKDKKTTDQYTKWIELSIFIGFLLLFELILVWSDPYVDGITGGEVIFKLLINAAIAAIIFPIHGFLESKLIKNVIRTQRRKYSDVIKEVGHKLIWIVALITLQSFNVSDTLVRTDPKSPLIESFETELKLAKEDTVKVNLLQKLGWKLRIKSSEEALNYINDGLALAKRISYKKGIAKLQQTFGSLYYNKGDYPKALKHHFKALKINKELGYKIGIADQYVSIGIVYWNQRDYPKALSNYFDGLKTYKELDSKQKISLSLGNIGLVYWSQGDYTNALKYYFEALEIDKELGDKRGMAFRIGNIGIVYKDLGESTKALKYYFEAMEIDKELGDKAGIARHLGNIGILYVEQAESYSGRTKLQQEKYKEAEQYLQEALKLCDAIGYLYAKIEFEKSISTLYAQTHQYQKAYTHHQKYSITKDSLFNEEKAKHIGRLEQKHEFELAELERKKQEEQQTRIQSEIKERKDNLQYSGALLFILFMFTAVFALGRFAVNIKLAEGLVFLVFLLLFELALVWFDPYIEQYTGGEPVYKLITNAVLAGVIFPMHGFFEKNIRKRIMKNKRA